MNVERHAHECLATVERMKMKLKLHSWEIHKTNSQMSRDCYIIVRLSRDIKLDRNSRIGHINAHSLRLQRGSCIYIVNLVAK